MYTIVEGEACRAVVELLWRPRKRRIGEVKRIWVSARQTTLCKDKMCPGILTRRDGLIWW
jgi:hypothetical protein